MNWCLGVVLPEFICILALLSDTLLRLVADPGVGEGLSGEECRFGGGVLGDLGFGSNPGSEAELKERVGAWVITDGLGVCCCKAAKDFFACKV